MHISSCYLAKSPEESALKDVKIKMGLLITQLCEKKSKKNFLIAVNFPFGNDRRIAIRDGEDHTLETYGDNHIDEEYGDQPNKEKGRGGGDSEWRNVTF